MCYLGLTQMLNKPTSATRSILMSPNLKPHSQTFDQPGKDFLVTNTLALIWAASVTQKKKVLWHWLHQILRHCCRFTNFVYLQWCPIKISPGVNVIKLFTAVIYCCSAVIPSFCVIKLYYYGNYLGMLVKIPWYFNLRKSRYRSKLPIVFL